MAAQIPSLLFFRFLQGVGAAPGLVLGPGVIGDIYKLEERGRAMSVFLSVSPKLLYARTPSHSASRYVH